MSKEMPKWKRSLNEMAKAMRSRDANAGMSKACKRDGHDGDALYCKFCGEKFENITQDAIA